MISSITLLGSSSGRNAGDAALMSGIMDGIDDACGRRLRYEIPTIKPRFVRENYANDVVPIGTLPWHGSIKLLGVPTYRSIRRTDLSLVFDAVLFDRSLYNPLFNFLSTFALLFPRAHRRGSRFGLYNCGTGPVTTPKGKEMLRRVCELCEFITVRDEDSYEILRDIGVDHPRMKVTADAALTVKPAPPERVDHVLSTLGLDPNNREILAINVNAYLNSWADTSRRLWTEDEFVAQYRDAIHQVGQKIDADLLFVVTQHHDLPLTRRLMSAISWPRRTALLSNTEWTHYDVKGVLGRVSLLFAMRLHAMILASSELTPIVGLPYQPKVLHYFRTAGIPELCMNIESFSRDSATERVLMGWERRHEIKAHLGEVIPKLKLKALEAAQIVRDLP